MNGGVIMKKFAILTLFLAIAAALTVAVHFMTGFSVWLSFAISLIASILGYLMLDLRPEYTPKDTVYNLTRGRWYKRGK